MPPGIGLYPFVLLTGPSGCGKSSVSKEVANSLHLHHVEVRIVFYFQFTI